MLIPTTKNVKTITDMREDALGLLNLVQKEPVYIFHRSKPQAVLLSIDKFISLRNAINDCEDKGIPLSVVASKYKK